MKINIGDVVEPRYGSDHQYADWNGLRLRVTELSSRSTIM